MQVVNLQLQRATRGAAQVARDVADIATAVSQRASARVSLNPGGLKVGAKHLVFILDREDPTALELLTAYAPPNLQLARGSSDDVEVVALSLADGLTLLRTPKHNRGERTIFHVVADQIADAEGEEVIGICVARGGFIRFALRTQMELH